MIKNVKIKKILVNYVFPFFSLLNKWVPKDENTIFIYCANGNLEDNSEALFYYLVENGYTNKYKIICGVEEPKIYKYNDPNILFIPKRKCIFQYMQSTHVFYSMGKMPIRPTARQTVINMWHGIPLKRIGKLSKIGNGEEFFFTYVCASSQLFVPVMAQAFGCPESNVIICGEPKADVLFTKKKESEHKLIVWAPTFRQSKFLGYNDSKCDQILPLFVEQEWKELNDELKKNDVNMVVKLHPLQDISGVLNVHFSNLRIYSDSEFKKENQNLFYLMSQADGLISDYSGVYLNFLVLNRPICFALADLNEYANTRGFVFDDPLEYMPGVHALKKEDIYDFIKDISLGIDRFGNERKRVNDLVNYYKDGSNCERVLSYSHVNKD